MAARWTEEEIQFLRDNYHEEGPAYCAEKLDRTFRALEGKAFRLGIKVKKGWTEEEIQFLRDNYPEKGAGYCAEKLSRTPSSVQLKAAKLDIKFNNMSAPWTEEEIQFLRDNYPEEGPAYCSEKLGRTPNSVTLKANRLDIKFDNKFLWTEEEIEYLIQEYPLVGASECAEVLERSWDAVRVKANRLGLCSPRNESRIVYLCKFPSLDLYKVGITNNWERRSRQFGQPTKLLWTKEFPNESVARDYEKHILSKVNRVNTGLLDSGNTETFRWAI
jgi:hypothetical protein